LRAIGNTYCHPVAVYSHSAVFRTLPSIVRNDRYLAEVGLTTSFISKAKLETASETSIEAWQNQSAGAGRGPATIAQGPVGTDLSLSA